MYFKRIRQTRWVKHLRGKHDQQDHGRRGVSSTSAGSGGGGLSGGSGIAIPGFTQPSNEGYALRPYDRAAFALDGPDKPAISFVDVVNAADQKGGGRRVSVMEQGNEGTRVIQKSVYDHFQDTFNSLRSILSSGNGPVSNSAFSVAERELIREQSRVRDYAQMIQDRESLGDSAGADLARGLMIETYALSEVYRETVNRGIMERRRATPHPTDALIAIKPDGTLDYVPSQRAIDIASAMNDRSHPFGAQLRALSATMKKASDEQTLIIRETNDLVRELRTANPSRQQEIKKRINELGEQRRKTSIAETQVKKGLADAVASLGFVSQTASPGRIPATFSTENISLLEANDVQRVARERLGIVQTLLQGIIPHSRLGFTKPLEVVLDGTETRAYAKRNISEIVVNPNDSSRIMMHEMLHIIENQHPVIQQRVNAFLQTRTRNSPLEPLSKYGSFDAQEQTKADNFGNPYIGKIYQTGSTEVLSMFADYLLTPTDARQKAQLHDDPEYLQFVIDVLSDPSSYQ